MSNLGGAGGGGGSSLYHVGPNRGRRQCFLGLYFLPAEHLLLNQTVNFWGFLLEQFFLWQENFSVWSNCDITGGV